MKGSKNVENAQRKVKVRVVVTRLPVVRMVGSLSHQLYKLPEVIAIDV